MNIYVGNIARESTDEEVKAVFDEFGTVESVNLIRDNYTKMLKGFGFIEMPSTDEAEKAIKSLDGQLFNGRPLIVNVAKPKTEGGSRNRSNSRGGGGGYGGGGNSRGGGGGYGGGGGNRGGGGGGNRY